MKAFQIALPFRVRAVLLAGVFSVHPGAAAFYNGTQQSFMDRYGNAIYLTPMVVGAIASMVAAAWRFLGVRSSEPAPTALEEFCALPGRIRRIDSDADLTVLEDEIDTMLRAHLKKSADHDESASEIQALIAAAHRIDNLIHHRRLALKAEASVTGPRENIVSPAVMLGDGS